MSSVLTPEVGATGNLFLDHLPRASAERLRPLLERIEGVTGTPLATAGQTIEYVVFPAGCVVSAVARMHNGSDIEIALIGREGFFGTQLVLGSDVSSHEAMVQIPGTFFRVRAAAFRTCLRDDKELEAFGLRYVSAALDAIGQFAACNRLHPIEERGARWLLMAHDRVPTDEIFLTHEYLAMMLGVRRPGVSVAAAALERSGLIAYHRGRIVVTDRPGLEKASCECYVVVNDLLRRQLGYDVRKRL